MQLIKKRPATGNKEKQHRFSAQYITLDFLNWYLRSTANYAANAQSNILLFLDCVEVIYDNNIMCINFNFFKFGFREINYLQSYFISFYEFVKLIDKSEDVEDETEAAPGDKDP